ncbi:MAG: hypothetical protein U0520_03285 [Candidatus Saccharimonadales bacterium]
MKQKFGTFALVTTALMVPLSILAGAATEFFLKRNNPNHIDITLGLAYLRPILQVGIGVAAVLFIASIVLALIGLKKDSSPQLAKVALLVLLIITLVSSGASLLKNRTDKLESTYTEKQLNTFFQKLSR